MRNMVMAGTAGLLLSFGAVSAANAENPNVPSYSPYAIMAYDASPMPTAPMVEHRAADPSGGYGASTLPNGNVPSYSPYAIMPQGK